MSFIAFLSLQTINGISYGLLLFLLASGLTLVFGLMRVVNLTHGSYYVIAGYVGYSMSQVANGNFWLSLAAGITVAALIGFLMERYLLRILFDRPLDQVLLTFGFVYIFVDLCNWIWAGKLYTIEKPEFLSTSVHFYGIYFPSYRLSLIFIGLATAFGLWYLQERTLVGAIIRAGVDDQEMLRGLGIKVTNYFTFTFILGSGLAGMAGVLGTPFIGVYPGLEIEVLILALVVTVIGGLGSVTGAFLASLLIGLSDAFGKTYFPQFSMLTIYLVMIVVLVLRPWGLLGRKI